MTPLRVLAVASEIYPIVKTGGLADVAGALPAAFGKLRVLLYFAATRPFDILPTIWYRLGGATLIYLKEKLAGRAPPQA